MLDAGWWSFGNLPLLGAGCGDRLLNSLKLLTKGLPNFKLQSFFKGQ